MLWLKHVIARKHQSSSRYATTPSRSKNPPFVACWKRHHEKHNKTVQMNRRKQSTGEKLSVHVDVVGTTREEVGGVEVGAAVCDGGVGEFCGGMHGNEGRLAWRGVLEPGGEARPVHGIRRPCEPLKWKLMSGINNNEWVKQKIALFKFTAASRFYNR